MPCFCCMFLSPLLIVILVCLSGCCDYMSLDCIIVRLYHCCHCILCMSCLYNRQFVFLYHCQICMVVYCTLSLIVRLLYDRKSALSFEGQWLLEIEDLGLAEPCSD